MRWWVSLACVAVAMAQESVDVSLSMADTLGQVHQPFQSRGKAASVNFFITHDCPISNRYAREIHRICDEFGCGVQCFLDYVDPDLPLPQAAKHAADYGHGNYPAFVDTKHLLVKAAGATVTPEAAVVLPDGKIAYRGRIDNKYVT